ncbi:MAG: hypothetical protein E7568_00460 [Ruminococcaceae bacterium]|nr:hypothetical protein [Oscillospiraceae bacterium]
MEQLLIAKIRDALRLKNNADTFKTVGFLSESQAAEVSALSELKGEKYIFYGGYEEAQRRFFVALPSWCDTAENLDIVSSVTFTYRDSDKLSHRDFLGTFMSLGINRECVGDILCSNGKTVAFFDSNVAEYIVSQVTKVGGVGVTIKKGYTLPLPTLNEIKDFTVTVASLRLDCVVASLIGTSREKAKEIITDKKVSVNSLMVDKLTYIVGENAKISIKGYGRFILPSEFLESKKGRVILNYSKYV